MKIFLLLFLFSATMSAQVAFPHNSASGGSSSSERVSNFTVAGAGNDRLEVANGTQNDGQFIPTFWSFRDTSNSFSMVFTSSISGGLDNGTSPLMLFTTTIPTAPNFNNSPDFVWGPSGTYNPIANRPLFEWRNASTKLMTIIANGNVGINTNNPTARFHTLGSVRLENLANATTPSFMLGTDSNGNVFEYPVPAGGSGGGTADADWLKPDGTVAMDINDNIYTNGFVGFNVQNPAATIHANGTVRLENLANGTAPNFILGTDANGNVKEYPAITGGVSTADADWLKPDGTVAMDINDNIYTNGFVGFNVQNPAANIHANGTVRLENLANGTTANYMLGTDGNGNVKEYPVPMAGTTDADWLKPDGTLPMDINDNIYTNGKVGINTNVMPTHVGAEDVSLYSLYVSGGILTEEVRVALKDEWADYVFKEDYNLAPLCEVEQQIKQTGHLKNIPGADKVKADGIELGEMNKLLLEKIEELTLYVIEMNKKIEAQQREMELLKEAKK